jgi:alpha-amylase
VGYHYIEVIAFRHNSNASAPPVYTDWTQTIYVDRGTPQSTIQSFSPFTSSPNNYASRQLDIQSTDGTATSAYAFLNLPSAITGAQIMSMITSGSNTINGVTYQGGQAGQTDSNLFAYGFNNLQNGNNVVSVVTYRPDGNYNIQRFTASQFPSLGYSTPNGLGLGDLSEDGKITTTDIFDFYEDAKSNGLLFNPAADFNGDGLINLTDWQAFGQELRQDNLLPPSNTDFVSNDLLALYSTLSTSVPEPVSGMVAMLLVPALWRRRTHQRWRG